MKSIIPPTRAHTRIRTTPEAKSSPIHVSPVQSMKYSQVLNLMLPICRRRQEEELWKHLEGFPRSLLFLHLRQPLSSTAFPLFGSAVTVVEEKHGALRRRFTLWPKIINKWFYQDRYIPRLQWNTTPSASVKDACRGVMDLTTSFFQTLLPSHLRGYLILCFPHPPG